MSGTQKSLRGLLIGMPILETGAKPRSVEESALAARRQVGRQVTEWFNELREPVYCYLLTICRNPEEAEELTQETFLRLFHELSAGRQVDNTRAWIFRVAHNLAISSKRRRRELSLVSAGPGEIDAVCDHAPNPEDLASEKERREHLAESFQKLTDQQKRCLHLRVQGLRYREIAGVLGISIWGVADALERAIRKLAKVSYE